MTGQSRRKAVTGSVKMEGQGSEMFSKNFTIKIAILVSALALCTTTAVADSIFSSQYLSSIAAITENPSHRSVEGRQIPVISIPVNQTEHNDSTTYHILIQGGLHGNEKLTTSFATWLSDRILKRESVINRISDQALVIDFVPIANPDGSRQNLRANANGVNLNRNFSTLWGLSREYPGSEAFSEPETRAIRDLMIKRNYRLAVDIHGYVNWIVAPSRPELLRERTSRQDARNYNQWVEFLTSQLQTLPPGYQLKTAGGLGDGGSFEDWSYWELGSPSVCLEMFQPQRFSVINGELTDTFYFYENFIYQAIVEVVRPSPRLATNPIGTIRTLLSGLVRISP